MVASTHGARQPLWLTAQLLTLLLAGCGGSGYGGSPGYSPSSYGSLDPDAAFLYGQAAVTNSIGRYHLSIQQASLAREKARQAQLERLATLERPVRLVRLVRRV